MEKVINSSLFVKDCHRRSGLISKPPLQTTRYSLKYGRVGFQNLSEGTSAIRKSIRPRELQLGQVTAILEAGSSTETTALVLSQRLRLFPQLCWSLRKRRIFRSFTEAHRLQFVPAASSPAPCA